MSFQISACLTLIVFAGLAGYLVVKTRTTSPVKVFAALFLPGPIAVLAISPNQDSLGAKIAHTILLGGPTLALTVLSIYAVAILGVNSTPEESRPHLYFRSLAHTPLKNIWRAPFRPFALGVIAAYLCVAGLKASQSHLASGLATYLFLAVLPILMAVIGGIFDLSVRRD